MAVEGVSIRNMITFVLHSEMKFAIQLSQLTPQI
jgi:hypothetical protein